MVVVIISAFFTVLVNTLDSARGRAESGPQTRTNQVRRCRI